ncbi:MAG: energy transducer TonB [Bacteroidetes bacterium CG12_big_fil_rev_8_21_14_0_65_60_17]|nr:MAG: energy transducer TonB [Bacteroidetes bacterium CG12_big_fil_rev_8_21_14_0_65_60_17]
MALRKTDKANLKKRYPLYVEIGLVATLALLIGLFRLDMTASDSFQIDMTEQEVVQMEEIIQTEQIEKPPPPPRPPVPVEVPNDEVLDDQELDLDVFLDLDEQVDLPPPPPPAEEEKEEEAEIFVIVEEMPELIGGLSALQKKIRYPEIAKKAGVEGRVFLQFVVDEQGNVVNPVVTRGIGAGCDEEAIRAIQSAKFTPGMQRGKPVKVKMSLPITFKLK